MGLLHSFRSMKPRVADPKRKKTAISKPAAAHYELEVVPGLEELASQEARERLGAQIAVQIAPSRYAETGALAVRYTGKPNTLVALRTVLAVYRVEHFAIPRPSALLGDQNWRQLLTSVQTVQQLHPVHAFRTVGLSAAGAESPVMQRIRGQLAAALQLAPASAETADLVVRLRPAQQPNSGWEALIRLTPRPLAVRSWRVADVKGALNATVAASMVRLTRPQAGDRFVNLCCGSATLLIERALAGPAQEIVGYDRDPSMLQQAQANSAASGLAQRITVELGDVRSLPLPAASVTALCADPPFGLAIGAHQENTELYPALLQEAARVAQPGARLVLITQEVRLMEQALTPPPTLWQVEKVLKLTLRGLHPRIYVLRRQQ